MRLCASDIVLTKLILKVSGVFDALCLGLCCVILNAIKLTIGLEIDRDEFFLEVVLRLDRIDVLVCEVGAEVILGFNTVNILINVWNFDVVGLWRVGRLNIDEIVLKVIFYVDVLDILLWLLVFYAVEAGEVRSFILRFIVLKVVLRLLSLEVSLG